MLWLFSVVYMGSHRRESERAEAVPARKGILCARVNLVSYTHIHTHRCTQIISNIVHVCTHREDMYKHANTHPEHVTYVCTYRTPYMNKWAHTCVHKLLESQEHVAEHGEKAS